MDMAPSRQIVGARQMAAHRQQSQSRAKIPPPELPPANGLWEGRRLALDGPDESDDYSLCASEELTALRAIVEAASHGSGEGYFQAVVRHLAQAVDAHYVFVAEFASAETNTRVRTIAFWLLLSGRVG